MEQKSKSKSESFKIFIVKALISLVVIFFGVGGGIFIGSALTGKSSSFITPQDLPNSSLLEIGEVFPNYQFTEIATGEVFKICDFTKKTKTILVIVSSTCEPCHVLADFWNKKLIDKIDGDVNILLVFDSLELTTSVPGENVLDLDGSISVSTNRFEQSKSDRILGTPTIVGLDRECKIRFISSGFTSEIDIRFISKYL